jgi:multiple sugar transport system substrate-binding protein
MSGNNAWGTLSRRRALRVTLIVGAGALGSGLLAACGGAATGTSSGGAATISASAATTTSIAATSTTGSTASVSASSTSSTTPTASVASSTSAQATTSATSTAAAATTAPAKAAAQLAVWTWWPDPVPTLKQIATSYQAKNPGVAVDVLAPSDYWNKVDASLAGNVGPDLYFMNNVNYPSYAKKGLLTDMDPLIARDADIQASLKQFWPDAVTFYKFQGKNYGLPYMYTTIVMYYNVDLLAAAAVPDLAGRQASYDWNAQRDDALKLTKRAGDQTQVWGLYSTQGLESGWLNWVRANGGDYLNQDSTKCVIDSAQSAAAWTYLTDLNVKDRVSPDATALKQGDLFLAGTLAMTPGGSWNMKTYNQKIKSFKYDITTIPLAPDTKKSGGTTNIVGLVLNKSGKQQTQTWSFLETLMTKESMDLMARADVLAPVRNDSAQLYYDPKLGPAHRGAAFDMVKWTTPLPTATNATYAEITKPANDLQGKILAGQVTVADGLQQMASLVNGTLGKS